MTCLLRMVDGRFGLHFISFRLYIRNPRWAGIPRSKRVCVHCATGHVCDKRHVLLECPALAAVALWHKDQMQVFKFVKACLIMTFMQEQLHE